MNKNDDNEFDAALMDLATKLPESVTPNRDLWPGIEQSIASNARAQPSSGQSMWVQAAAVLLLVGASSALTYSVVTTGGPTTIPGGPAVTRAGF